MAKYVCLSCGYSGENLVFQFTDYTYCLASNEDGESEYLGAYPTWVDSLGLGDADIGEPVGCPQCHAWGTGKFAVLG